MVETPDEDELVEEVNYIKSEIRNDDDSLRPATYQFTLDELVRLGEIAFTGNSKQSRHARKARKLIDDISEDVTERQARELANEATSEFTPQLIYLTGQVIHEIEYFPDELRDVIPELVQALDEDRGTQLVKQSIALTLVIAARKDADVVIPHINTIGRILIREVQSGHLTPVDPALISTIAAVSETSPTPVTEIVPEIMFAGELTSSHFRQKAVVTLRQVAEKDPATVRETVSELEPIMQKAIDNDEVSTLVEVCRLLVMVQGSKAVDLLTLINDSTTASYVTSIIADAREDLDLAVPGDNRSTEADHSIETNAPPQNEVDQEGFPTSVSYQARLLAEHLRVDVDNGCECTEIIRWLHEVDDFLSTYQLEAPMHSELEAAVDENIMIISEVHSETLTDAERINKIQTLSQRFESLYTRNI